ncbi:MAG: cell division protein FtsB [bacterium]
MRDFQNPRIVPPQRETVTRNVVSPTAFFSKKLILTLVILLFVAMFFVFQRLEYAQTEKRVKLLAKEKQKIIATTLPLQLEERYLTQLDYIEKSAKEEFSLIEPKAHQIKKIIIKIQQVKK